MRCLVAILAPCALLAVASSSAGAPNPANQARLDGTVRFLQNAQQPNGGFAQKGEPGQGTSAWVTNALSAAGINPQDQARPCGVDAYSFLVGHFREGLEEELAWPRIATTAFERELLVVDAAGTDPHSFAGFDLVAEILARANSDGSFPYITGGRGEINDTVFAMLALSPVQEPAAQAAVQHAAEWLIEQQNGDGGWSWEVKGGLSEVDLTGAAIEALNAAERRDTTAQSEALDYLRAVQAPDGGFPELPNHERESNVASTAWAVQGLWAAGENPETWLTGSGEETEEPLDYMESMQDPSDGHIRWRKSEDMNGIWMTAYVAPAFAGQALPIPEVPRAANPPVGSKVSASAGQSAASGSPVCEDPGQGGESPQPRGGVIAGGGGRGAPLFSRPKPQSKGRTPGGARVINNKGVRPIDHSKNRRGANAKQPTGTETSEPARSEPAPEEIEAVGAGGSSAGPGSGSDGTGLGASGATSSAPTGRESPGSGSQMDGPTLSGFLASKARDERAGDHEVSGVVVGSTAGTQNPGGLAFGAPGLHGAGAGAGHSQWVAAGIAAAALLFALFGSQLERRRGDSFA